MRSVQLAWTAWLVLLAGGVLGADELPEEWRHWSQSRDIHIEALKPPEGGAGNPLVRVAVPEALFKEARSDLADLRILNDRGEDVGYVVFARGSGPVTEWRPTALSDVGFVAGAYTQLVADTGDDGTLHNAVEVTLPRAEEEFFTWVEVAASADRQTWRVVRARAPLYRFRDRGFGPATGISYPRTRDRWLRLRLRDGETEVAVERLRVAERVEEDRSLTRIRRGLARSSASPDGESWWQPHGELSSVPIAAARFETQRSAFHRPVTVSSSDDGKTWRQVGEGTIYRYEPDAGVEAAGEPGTSQQALQIDVRDTAAPFWRVTVLDRGDPPIADLAVTLMQDRRYVVFRPEAGSSYRLLYGNQRAVAPEYEIEKLVSRDALAAAALAELGDEHSNDAWVSSEPFTERHPIILWAALALAVLVVGGLALKSLRS